MGTEKGICSGGGRRNPHESMRDRRKASVNGAKQGSKASQRVEVARSSRIFEAMFYLQPNTTNGKTHRNFKQEGGGILFFKRLRKAWIEETPYTPVYACGSYGNAGERKWQGGLMELQENRGVEKYLEEKLTEFGNGSYKMEGGRGDKGEEGLIAPVSCDWKGGVPFTEVGNTGRGPDLGREMMSAVL